MQYLKSLCCVLFPSKLENMFLVILIHERNLSRTFDHFERRLFTDVALVHRDGLAESDRGPKYGAILRPITD